jgi:predicted nucleic acid-binding protein
LVVDASVAIKWFLPEPHDDHAARLRKPETGLDAPDLIFAEVGNALWKRVRRGELTPAVAGRIIAALSRMPIETYPSRQLAGAALQIACTTGITAYDALYVATALLTDSRLVTADRRLFEAARGRALLRERVLWVENIPA